MAGRPTKRSAKRRTPKALPKDLAKDDAGSLREAERAIRKTLAGRRNLIVVRERDGVKVRLRAKAARGGKQETAFERLDSAGLIGVFRSGLGDLSTNPEHMKGFGK
jgi:hypothetical protein